MNRAQRLEYLFIEHGGKATLGQLIEATKADGGLAFKLTQAISELRSYLNARGKNIVWIKKPRPSDCVYAIVKKDELPLIQ